MGLIVGDIDHFKIINDEYGHSIGDAVLENVAVVLRWRLRAFDLAYRLGGEEFLILLPGADLADRALLADRIHSAIYANETGRTPITMSFGVSASRSGEPFEYERTFAEADGALYTAKRKGRDRVCVSAAAAPVARAPVPATAS